MSDSRCDKAKLLIDNGADVNAKDNQGNTPFHNACNYGSYKIASLLLRHGANPHMRNNKDESAYGIVQDHQDLFVLASILNEVLQKCGSIDDEEEKASCENILKNQMDIGDIRKEMMDMRRSIDSLKESDDRKDDDIRLLKLQNKQQVREIWTIKSG